MTWWYLMHGHKRLGLRPDNPAALTRLPNMDGDLGRQVRFFRHGEMRTVPLLPVQ
jgi:hypothetical protein